MADRKSISERDRDSILREAGYRCAVPACKTTLAIDLHHIVEVSEGGGNELANLLALCPTCHALYHRGTITLESIRKWKERLVALNQVVDVRAESQAHIEAASAQQVESPANYEEEREGISLAAAEFSWRTCEVGFVYEGDKLFVETGYCCFVGPKLALTIAEVVDWACEIAEQKGGTPVVRTDRGLATFTVRERFDLGKVVAIEIGLIDDGYINELLSKHDNELAAFFREPLQTIVRFRFAPFIGERVGILHSAKNSESHRSARALQYDSADVAFQMKCDSSETFLQFALSPVLSHIQHRGAPVFSSGGRLVGIVNDTILLQGEQARRPVVSPVLMLKKLLAKDG